MEKLVISDVKADNHIAQVTVSGVEDIPGVTYKIFRQLSAEGIIVDMILQAAGRNHVTDLVFTTKEDVGEDAVGVLLAHKNELNFQNAFCNKGMAKITLSGTGLMSHSDIVPRVLSCFHYSNAPMDLVSTSEIAIKVFTDAKKSRRVVEKIREEFVDYGI